MDARVADLLKALSPQAELELSALFDAIETARFTGPVTIDFLNGSPRQISLGQPVKLAICHASANGSLDKPTRPRAR